MEEVEVVKRTYDYLINDLNYHLWIHDHTAYKRLNPKDYPRHTLTIKGYTPDLVGVNQFDEIVAIEAKGSKDLPKWLSVMTM